MPGVFAFAGIRARGVTLASLPAYLVHGAGSGLYSTNEMLYAIRSIGKGGAVARTAWAWAG
jgi:hypothetical protein